MPAFISSTLLVLLCLSSAARPPIPSPESSNFVSEPPFSLSPQPAPENCLIHEACKASRDPPTCESVLSQSTRVPHGATLLGIAQSATWVSSESLSIAISMVNEVLELSADNLNLTLAAKHCLEALVYSVYRKTLTADALLSGRMKDSRAWMSAALGYEIGCSAGLQTVNGTFEVNEIIAFLDNIIGLTSNALGMMVNYDNFGEETGSWGPPRTERADFWEQVDGSQPKSDGGVPSGCKADVTVCKGVGCDHEKVQEAVNAAPNNEVGRRFVIWIKAGVYEETVRVPLEKKNVVLLGDGMGKTVITGSLNVGMPGMTTFDSATVGVVGDGFMASNLTIKNTAGPDAHQAVAFRSSSDQSVVDNCEFIGNQDTLYAHSLRQYYKSCRIQGNVDFIFGNAAAIFQDCLILVAPRQLEPEKGENNAVTAHGRTDAAQSTGFVFQNCVINGTEEYMKLYHRKPGVHKNFLGRPWKQYSRTVFMYCTMEALITPEGWMPWNGDFALDTLYYGEFENNGLGANMSARVSWSSKIPAAHVRSYSVQNFIQGDDWIPTSS